MNSDIANNRDNDTLRNDTLNNLDEVIDLDEDEFSDAFTSSFNFTKDFNKVQTNFLVEGFYTSLQNPFTIVSTGSSLPNGSILEETRNGVGAYVAGTNLELSISPNKQWYFRDFRAFVSAQLDRINRRGFQNLWGYRYR